MRSELDPPGALLPTPAQRVEPSPMAGIVCRKAISAAERADHFAIRHHVFVDEQAVFTGSDQDSHDQDDSVIRLLGYCDGAAAGTVRLFELDRVAGLWQGDRLAVLAPYRVRGVGAPLVRCAVATASVRGGHRMNAHIQLANVPFFRRLGWAAFGETEIYAGLVHQPMTIVLPTAYEGAALVRVLGSGVNGRDR